MKLQVEALTPRPKILCSRRAKLAQKLLSGQSVVA
jgi:hypothetical protein